MSEDKRKKESFIQEQIRKKPFYKTRCFQKSMNGLGIAAVFGLSIGMAFGIARPWAEQYFGNASFTAAKEQEELPPLSVSQVEAAEERGTAGNLEEELAKVDLNDYEALYKEIMEVADKVRPSVVTVMGLNSEIDLFNTASESSTITTGVIIGDTETAMWLLAEGQSVADVDEIKVAFFTGSIAEAELIKADQITDLAILKIFKEDVEEATLEQIKPATFGLEANVKVGDPLIAMSADSISFGMTTSRPFMNLCDGSYREIRTDIVGVNENGGILANLKGEVVGILGMNAEDSENTTTLSGVGILALRALIDSLATKNSLPYLGITGKEVTDALARELSMPKGVLVSEIEEGSPAMMKGIQRTDIISGMNGQTVRNMFDYMRYLKESEPGETMTVSYWRKGILGYQEKEINVILGER